METTKNLEFIKDVTNNKVTVIRYFDAPVEHVWRAWTETELIDQWWAPKPWKAETKEMDFRESGVWLYCMVGPEGERHWCRVDYKSINRQKSFTCLDAFCDENGSVNQDFPTMYWKVDFSKADSGTIVSVEVTFSSEADLEKIVEMGFEEGFTSALGNLDELLSK
jgi:PhnB protein